MYSLLWALSGDGKLKSRQELGEFIRGVTTVPLPSQTNVPIIDFEVRFELPQGIFLCAARDFFINQNSSSILLISEIGLFNVGLNFWGVGAVAV